MEARLRCPLCDSFLDRATVRPPCSHGCTHPNGEPRLAEVAGPRSGRPLCSSCHAREQKQVNKFYWKLEYDDMQPAFKSGDIWVTYAWPNDYNDMLAAGLKTGYMDPSEGRLAWYCGFIMLKSSENYYHNHKYVDSFIGHDACVDLFNAFVYASANSTVKKGDLAIQGPSDPKAYALPAAADALRIGDPNRLAEVQIAAE